MLDRISNSLMRFKIHTVQNITPLELHHGRKPRTELTNVNLKGKVKSFLSTWSELSISAENRPKKPIYITRNGEGEVSNHINMAQKKRSEGPNRNVIDLENSIGNYPF